MTFKQQFGLSVRDRIASVAVRFRNRNKTPSKHCQRWRSRHECLEPRRLLAGDVQVQIQDGSLHIYGDDLDNGVSVIAGSAPNQLVITGVDNNGPTTINGQWQEVVNVTSDVFINLRDGNDNFYFNASEGRNVSLPGQLRILGRGGDDQINLTTIDALFEVHGKTQIDTGAGEDTVTIQAEGLDAAMIIKDYFSILTRDGQDDVTIEATGKNATIEIPTRLAIYPGNDGDNVTVSAREDDSVVSVGDLKITDPHGEDSITVQAFRDNASLTVNGGLCIKTGVGEDVVRVTAFRENARVTLMNDMTINTGDSEDAILIEAEFGSATLIANGDIRLNSGNDADLVRFFANQDDARIVAREYVKMDTGDSGLFAGGDYAMILASGQDASATFEKNVLIRTGNSLDLENYVLVKASDDNATLNFGRDLTIRVDDSPQFGASVNVIAGGGNGSGEPQINVAENLRIVSGTGPVDVTIEARSNQSTLQVGNDLRIYCGAGPNHVQILSSTPEAELIIADDLKVLLGDGDDSLTFSGITVIDNATLYGEGGFDQFHDGVRNVFGSVNIYP